VESDRLFTPRFFLMCGFSFTVFLSAFQLLPTAPFRVLQLGGGKFAAGLVLGFLTYASAISAPFTGALADRLGRRRTLLTVSLVLASFALLYAWVGTVWLLLGLVLVHGVFWSALLSASAAYVTESMPDTRRAEGISYWGMASTFSVALAPTLGLVLFDRGWGWVCLSIGAGNLAMAAIAWRLPDDRHAREPHAGPIWSVFSREALEWRVTLLAVTLFLCAFGYGGITSFVALYADASGVARGLWFAAFSGAVILTRPFSGRLADRVGHVRVLIPCMVLSSIGYAMLALGGSTGVFAASAVVFGAGFGSAYPTFAAFVMAHIPPARRGAAFGGILAALDTGIGSGSMVIGWTIEHYGFRPAYGLGAVCAVLAIPYFLAIRPVFLRLSTAGGR
jgi:MFS family permease